VAVLDSPTKGPAGAPVTLIEFADFECPYCAIMAPRLDEAFNKFRGQIRFAYKFMPLSGHPHGEIAARAAIAALDQGKFWEMHHLLFANRDHLEPPDLDSYAKQLGLDMNKFHLDANSQATTDRIAADRKQADDLDVKGTPTIYINGRDYDPQSDLDDWLSLELVGETKARNPAAEGSGGRTSQSSAAPQK
jgi:protein-disulfide isomerase